MSAIFSAASQIISEYSENETFGQILTLVSYLVARTWGLESAYTRHDAQAKIWGLNSEILDLGRPAEISVGP